MLYCVHMYICSHICMVIIDYILYMYNNMFLFFLRLYDLLDLIYSKQINFPAGFVTTCIYIMKCSNIYLYFPFQIPHFPPKMCPKHHALTLYYFHNPLSLVSVVGSSIGAHDGNLPVATSSPRKNNSFSPSNYRSWQLLLSKRWG